MMKFVFLAVFLGGGVFAIDKILKANEGLKESKPLELDQIDYDQVFEDANEEYTDLTLCIEENRVMNGMIWDPFATMKCNK